MENIVRYPPAPKAGFPMQAGVRGSFVDRGGETMRVLAALLLFSSLLCFSLKLRAQASDQEQIKSAETDLAAAEHRNDSAVYKKIMAVDWMTVTQDGRLLHRDDVVRGVSEHEGERKPYIVKLAGLRVDMFGDTAVASFTREYHGISGEAKGKVMRESVVDVFTKTPAGWKMRYEKGVPLPEGNSTP